MIKTIIKRDGRVVKFDRLKIKNAISKALLATNINDSSNIAQILSKQVVKQLESEGEIPEIEHIQDIVEEVLIANGYLSTAKAYILYRANRSKRREMNSNLMRIYDEITFSEAKDSDIKRENANIDSDTAMGTMLKYGSEGAKQYYNMFVLKPEHAKAHSEGDIHIHDLDFYTLTTTCTQIDIIKLFKNGFSTGHGFLREPNDITSYSALACIAIQANQNDQHGGQSIVNFDYGMAEGVKKTFKNLYRENLTKVLEILVEESSIDLEDFLKSIFTTIETDYHLIPNMSDINTYWDNESQLLDKLLIDSNIIKNAQKKAYNYALKEIDRKTYQAMEAFIANLNTMHSRAGAQTPFSSINYGLDSSPEGRLVIKNILLATEAGLGNGETALFPIQIFRVKEGKNFNPEDDNYDLFKLACKVSAKRLFPNFSFLDAPFNLEYYDEDKPETEIAYMGCRTRVIGNTFDKNNEICNGRGNLSFTSINLPRLALKSRGNLDSFFKSLDSLMDLVIDQLKERMQVQSAKKVKNYPFLMGQGVWIDSENLDWEDSVEEVLKHGSLACGFIGLAECLKILTGYHHGESESAQKLGIQIISFMRDKMDNESQKTGLNFSLIATPAEGLSGRFIKMDRERYGEIPGINDREYYTNSFHIPVYHEITAYNKIKLEAPYHALTNGGHISYVEMDGDPSNNVEAFEKIIRCMKESGIGYGSINHPVDRDPVCGYTGIINDVCPGCGRTEENYPFERIRRITGYLVGTLDRFNNAKRAEEKDRVKHGIR